MGLESILQLTFKMIGVKENFLLEILDQASNGQEALDIVRDKLSIDSSNSYGLIFMDCSMPIMDGYKSSKEIRKVYHQAEIDQPIIIALTGHTEDVYIKKAF